MKFSVFFVVAAAVCSGFTDEHRHDHPEQMPFDYVKFPYEQPLYRTSTGEGKFPLLLGCLDDGPHIFRK